MNSGKARRVLVHAAVGCSAKLSNECSDRIVAQSDALCRVALGEVGSSVRP
jgi:hypothetical protein